MGVTLRAEGVAVRAGGRALVESFDVHVRAGTLTALLGPNGAGKSTALKVLSGSLRPDAGTVRLNGRLLPEWTPAECARLRAVLMQDFHVPFAFSAEEVVAMGRHPHAAAGSGRARDRAVVHECLHVAGVQTLRGTPYPVLSGGERQRVHWARTLAQLEPGTDLRGKCLLLDEPTSSLDPAHQHTLLGRARDLAAVGCAVLVVVHDLNLAAEYADTIVLMKSGRVIAQGPPADVMTPALLSAVYGIDAAVARHPGHGGPWMYVRSSPARVRGGTDTGNDREEPPPFPFDDTPRASRRQHQEIS